MPRTIGFVGRALLSGEVDESVPRPALTLGLAAQVALDEVLLAVAMTPNRFPLRADYHRVSEELATARKMFRRRGWIAQPTKYHRTPPGLDDGDVTRSRGSSLGTKYERITFDSRFTPRTGEPGGERWVAFRPNHTAAATILQHPGEPRPWVVGIHGFCMGFPVTDYHGLHVDLLHKELGFNVAMPVLPLHGSRRVTRISGEPFLSFELMNAVHGITQSIWDIRRLITWIRGQGAPSVSVYGVSLGAYVASVLVGIEDGLDAVVAGIPVSDFPGLFHEHSPHHIRARSIEHNILGGTAEEIYTVVSPFSFAPKTPRERRFVFAGYGDRLSTPGQARRLWTYWDEPEICWYSGDHVGYLWSRQVRGFLRDALGTAPNVPRPLGA
ncbi:MAG: alpha/beta hydrolase family protein [Acidimicrobiales bacterium]